MTFQGLSSHEHDSCDARWIIIIATVIYLQFLALINNNDDDDDDGGNNDDGHENGNNNDNITLINNYNETLMSVIVNIFQNIAHLLPHVPAYNCWRWMKCDTSIIILLVSRIITL